MYMRKKWLRVKHAVNIIYVHVQFILYHPVKRNCSVSGRFACVTFAFIDWQTFI